MLSTEAPGPTVPVAVGAVGTDLRVDDIQHGLVVPTRARFGEIVMGEFRVWLAGQRWNEDGMSPVYDRDGSPDGWTVVAHRPHTSTPDIKTTGLFLMKRAAGGWTIIRRSVANSGTSRATMESFHLTLAELYEHLASDSAPRDLSWIERHLVTMYDPSDEVEAAHQTLCALGAPMRVLPSAAHRFADA